MLQENLQDATEIMHNILTTPLSIEGSSSAISLQQAASQDDLIDLKNILHSLVNHSDSTQVLLTELRLLSQDLNESMS